MATFTADDVTARLDSRVREAWESYKDGLGHLDGRDYDDAEAASWDALQATLRDIESERTRTVHPGAA